MCASSSSPPQIPFTTLDGSHTTPVESPLSPAEHATRPQRDSPSLSSQSPALPTVPDPSPRHRTFSSRTSMSATQSNLQPSPAQQKPTTNPISNISNTSCLIPPVPAAPSRRDQRVKVSSQPRSSGIVDPASFPMKHRQSITSSFSFPGATTSATTYDCTYSADAHCTLTTTPSAPSISTTTPQQTPNVYINGLPPHFSEQQLFALARPFGNIKSVRTFTRHVSEKPTGYGFVLFNDVESAQDCIEGLRKSRNLHPSFSKQVHRIPGTEYAQHCTAQSTDQDENSFKSRMERLKDVNSTNLYIEGLPLSIDEESLSALILPYKIKSSRFFKTKLSHPPRIIAFVRLETRAAAEETIDRLHGRMVRGWNDPGCRISVRFADSAEQRELRRAERTSKNDDQSPSRLTIAQASLLNLRGQELQENIRDVGGTMPQLFTNSQPDSLATFSHSCEPGLFPPSRSLPSKLSHASQDLSLPATSELPSASEMDTLLQSIRNGYEDGSLDNTMRSFILDNDYLMTQQTQLRVLANAALLSPRQFPITLPRGHTQARNGFTPAEELILEAHSQRLQYQAQSPQTSPVFPSISNTDILKFNSVHESLQASGLAGNATLYHDAFPTVTEDEFHTMRHSVPNLAPTTQRFQGPVDSSPPNLPSTRNSMSIRPPSRAISIVPPPPNYEDPGKRSKYQHQRTGRSMVSTQISSLSSSFSNSQSTLPNDAKIHPSLLQTSMRSNNIGCSSNANNNTRSISHDGRNELQHTYVYSHGDVQSRPEEEKSSNFHSSKLGGRNSSVKEELESPSTISPALTYSSRTPSTLSPATPFFGSFTGSQDTFEIMTMGNEGMAKKKLKPRVANN